MSWIQIYEYLGVTEFIYFISSPIIQEKLFYIKLVFIAFGLFFLVGVFYFYLNSTYLQYQFLQDASEFFSWQPYGLRTINKRWRQIIKKTESRFEDDYKLAIIEADDFLYQVLEEAGFRGESFEELSKSAGARVITNLDTILQAHEIRNSIVYNQDFRIEPETAKN